MMLINSNQIKAKDYVLGFCFCILNGFVASSLIPAKTYLLSGFGLLFFLSKKKKMNKSYLLLAIGFLTVFYAHKIVFGIIDKPLLDMFLLMSSGLYICVALGRKMRLVLFLVMYWIALINLSLYLLFLVAKVSPCFFSVLDINSCFLWGYNSEILNFRNIGPAWEPGVFAGMLLSPLYLYFGSIRSLYEKYRTKLIVVCLALLTTLSTQGLVILLGFVLFEYTLKFDLKNIVKYLLVGLLMGILSFVVVSHVPVLGNKINEQLMYIDTTSDSSVRTANRFVTTLIDIEHISEHPFLGKTSDQDIMYDDNPIILNILKDKGSYGSGSGFTNFMAANGIPLFIFWLILSVQNIYRYFNGDYKKTLLLFVLLIAAGQCENYMSMIFFLSLPFYKTFTNKSYENSEY